MAAKRSAKPRVARGHRTRVGRERRRHTRARILAAAVEVCAKKRGAAPVIEDVINAAGIAHGTFYNYFNSVEEVIQAATSWLEDQLIIAITDAMGTIENPAERATIGMRLWMKKAEADPVFCSFVAHQPLRGGLVEREVGRDVRDALRLGLFTCPSLEIGRDLLVGTIREAMVRITEGRVPASYSAGVVRVVLRGLGLEPAAIERFVRRPLPAAPRPPGSPG